MLLDLTPAEIARFWARVDRSGGPDACWPWLGSIIPSTGYGQVSYRGHHFATHRLAFILVKGPFPPDKPIGSHICNSRPCCNPDHVVADTQRGNLLYMQECGRKSMGDDHWMRKHPEKVTRGDSHYARIKPELVLRGSLHGISKIAEADVIAIRVLASTKTMTQEQIGQRFGIDQTNVSLIVRRKAWSHVP